MKRIILILFLLSSLLSFAQPGLDWVAVATAGGASSDIVEDVFVDAAGNTFACGNFTGTLTLGSTAYNAGSTTQAFIVKYNSIGVVQWSLISGGDSKAFAHTIFVDDDGFIYVAGHHTSTITNFGALNIASTANEEMFILKLTPAGNPLHLIGPDITNSGKSQILAITGNNTSIFVTGYYFNSPLILGGNTTLPPTQDETFVARMDTDLTVSNWLAEYPGSRKEHGYGIAIDGNDVYVTGKYGDNPMTFSASPSNYVLPSYGKEAIWLMKCAVSTGSVDWATSAGGDIKEGYSYDVTTNAGDIFITGFCADSTFFVSTPSPGGPFTYNDTIFSNGGSDIFVGKYNSNGDLLAVWSEGGTGDDEGHGITVDPTCGEVEICGTFNDNVNFGGSELLIASGTDMFVASYDYNGVLNWAFQENSAGNENANSISANNGRTSVGGEYSNTTTFSLVPPIPFANNGSDDHFVSSFQCANAIICGPDIICRVNDTVTAGAACTWVLGNYVGQDTITDGCALGYTETQSPIAGTVLPAGNHTITMTVTDANSNSAVCSFTLVIEANVNPTLVNCGDILLGETTGGAGDNGGPFSCTVTPTPGEDVYYQITVPTGNYLIGVSMANVADVNDAVASTFWVGGACPLGSGCISADDFNIGTQTFASNGLPQVLFNAVGPGTYYFVVDSETDSIDTYDISFKCIVSGIEFDETNCGLDVDNDGIYATVDASPLLNVAPCQTATFCHTIYTQNIFGGEWLDTVIFDLGPCYTNITNMTPDAPGPNGFYDGAGTWDATYNGPSNSILWAFDHSSINVWGDGFGGIGYTCRAYTFCFDADISATCSSNNDLDIQMYIEDDAVNGAIPNVAQGFDYATSNNFIIVDPPPTITCPANVVVNNDVGVCTAVVNGIAPSAIGDNCPVDSVSYVLSGVTTGSGLNDASGTTFNVGVTTITYTVTDSVGNTTSCIFTVTVNDNENPTITCPGNVVIACPAIVNGIAPIATGDNCGIDSVNYVLTGATTGSGLNDASGIFYNNGVTTVTYTITDLSGNLATCFFTITATDIVNPTITCPANVSVNNDVGNCSALVNGIAPTAFGDNCGVDSVSFTLSGATILGNGLNDASGNTFNVGLTTVTYTITDLSGNTATCNFTVTVIDNETPTITCPGNLIINNDPGVCTAVVNGIPPVRNDNCSGIGVSYTLTGATIASGLNDASGLTFNLGVTTIKYIANDANGNADSCTFTVTVIDNENPTLSCPSNVVVNNDPGLCSAVVTGLALTAAGDNCGIDSISYVLTGATTGSGLNNPNGTAFNVGVTTVTNTVTDNSGNTTSCFFTVTVNDVENPTITCPPNASFGNDIGFCSAVITGIAPIASGDNCVVDSVSYVLSGATILGNGLNDASNNTFNLGVTTVTYTITDTSGNTTSCFFTVTVTDNEQPTLTCPGNLNVANDSALCTAVVNGIAPLTFGDNCAIDSVSFAITGATIGTGLNDASGTTFNSGSSTVTYTVTDSAGNSTSCNFTINITDTTAPVIVCPGNVNAVTTAAACNVIVTGIAPISTTDNCGVDTVFYILNGATNGAGVGDASGLLFNVGTTIVNYYVIDLIGNTDSCSFTIDVVDSINPTISCPANVLVNNDAGTCDAVVINIGPNNFSDNCTVDSVYYILSGATNGNGGNDASNTTFNAGITTVQYIVQDLSGNTDTCAFTVTVVDNENPTITCPANIVICDTNVVVALPVVGDNCMVGTIVNDFNLTNDASGVYPYGVKNVNWTVTDTAGNINGCLMMVEVEIPPISNAGPDQILVGVNSTNMDAVAPLVGVGSWAIVSGFGDIANLSDPLSFINDLDKGENIFEWTVAFGTCANAVDEVIISVIPLNIPNGFSPNGDGDNDLFVIEGLEFLENEVAIFNRWGIELFSAINYQNDWDGRSQSGSDLPEDTYFYIIKVHDLNEELSGFVVLKR